ncbi:MAG: T9SS type A sorting domain-containing protein [Bacteroidetes bacterium]|nr:T9SS type A sorting domain-containing protein [Bacteroidota bacterium]
MSIYPNPANDFMTVSLVDGSTEATTIYIMNALGEIVLTEKATSSNTTLNINNLTNGIYFIKVESKKWFSY